MKTLRIHYEIVTNRYSKKAVYVCWQCGMSRREKSSNTFSKLLSKCRTASSRNISKTFEEKETTTTVSWTYHPSRREVSFYFDNVLAIPQNIDQYEFQKQQYEATDQMRHSGNKLNLILCETLRKGVPHYNQGKIEGSSIHSTYLSSHTPSLTLHPNFRLLLLLSGSSTESTKTFQS
jgi:hypothetical protein